MAQLIMHHSLEVVTEVISENDSMLIALEPSGGEKPLKKATQSAFEATSITLKSIFLAAALDSRAVSSNRAGCQSPLLLWNSTLQERCLLHEARL